MPTGVWLSGFFFGAAAAFFVVWLVALTERYR